MVAERHIEDASAVEHVTTRAAVKRNHVSNLEVRDVLVLDDEALLAGELVQIFCSVRCFAGRVLAGGISRHGGAKRRPWVPFVAQTWCPTVHQLLAVGFHFSQGDCAVFVSFVRAWAGTASVRRRKVCMLHVVKLHHDMEFRHVHGTESKF